MTEHQYQLIHDGFRAQHPVKAWIKGVDLEDKAREQILNVATMPFIHKHVAIMPDAHWGFGCTIGSVIATQGAIIPSAVGVDIGCGMMAVQTSLTASDLPDNLLALRTEIENKVPHGRTAKGGAGDRGAWCNVPEEISYRWATDLLGRYESILGKHPKAKPYNTFNHMGTLGTGNHFIEICLDENHNVWAMLHSGSRGPGNKFGQYFIEKAKEEMRRWFINLPDVDLAYLPEGSDLFNDYLEAVNWAQDYALLNRQIMMRAVLKALADVVRPFNVVEHAVNCHHNYVAREHHFGANVLVTRKGAVRAREGDLGIIPGSMGAKSFIVRGKGNADSFHSCSHGAGRKMSRTAAEKMFTVEDHAAATAGVECRKDASVIDETPGAYKSIDAVMAAQSDLIDVVATLKQVLCVKG